MPAFKCSFARSFLAACGAAAALAACAGTASATPLKLDYCVTDIGGGQYQYEFVLTLDNHDGSWSAGQGYNWIIWGDVAFPGPTTLPDFVGDLPAPVPFADEGFSSSGGGHNGPTLLDFGVENDFRGWIPTGVGDSITWSGKSSVRLGAGEMIWSNLVGSGVHADFEVATLQTTCGGGTCPADFDKNGFVNGDDYDAYVEEFFLGNDDADFNHDGFVTGDDFDAFSDHFEAGC